MELSALGPNERPEEVQFADSLEQFSSSGDTFDLVEKYKIITHNSYVSLRNAIVQAENLRAVGPSSSSSLQLKKQECLLLQQERNTWLLLHDLERDRESVMEEEETMKERNASDDMDVAKSQAEISANSKFIKLSDKKTVENLISKDYVLRQHMIVVRWLEAITEDDFEYFSQEVLWLNTLSELNQRSRLQASSFRSPELADLVTRIDPDAETRELKSLHPHDKEDEERILQSIWNLLRLGKLDTAVQLCRTANMFWRAATLNGALLYHHNVLDNPYDTSVEGNELRFLWKNQCVSLSKNDRTNPFERAIYGLLGGNLEPVLAVCRNYNDILWANYSVLLNAKIDENLAKHQSVFSEDLPINVLNSNINNITPPSNNNPAQTVQNKYIRSEDAIFSELRNHNDLEIRRQAHERYHIIQEKLVLGQTDELLILMSQWVSETYRDQGVLRFSCPPQLLRFGAHFVLFYFREGFPEMADDDAQLQGTTTLQVINAATNIIAAYIRHLQETNQIARIALYTSKLPASRQVETYAQFCSHIMDREQREECLLLADKASLDITAITKRVVEIIINSTTATVVSKHKTLPFFKDQESEDFDFANISVDDQVKIHAIEWLCFDPSHRAEALLQSLKLARLFLESRRLDSAHLLLYRVLPEDTVEVVEENSQPDDTLITNAIREYTAFRLLLGSHKLFRTWFAYHSSKPIAPALSPSDKGNMVAEFQYNAKLREFANQFEQWQEEEDKRATNSKVTILQILQFPGGWLCDATEDPSVTFHLPVNQDRGRQLQALRKLYTPDLFYMLHMVLHETQQYAESLELASLVADEKNKLYALFNKDELQKFLERLRKSAIAILGKSKDDLSQTNVF